MLFYFLSLFVGPLYAICLWGLLESSELAHRPAEQVQIDAVGLSLCHQDRSLIENWIEPQNAKIKALQIQLRIQTLACQAEAAIAAVKGGPGGYVLAFRACANSRLLPLAKIGKVLELRQQSYADNTRTNRRHPKLQNLLDRNQISREDILISKEIFLPASLAFSRANLQVADRLAEGFCLSQGVNIHWPKEWKPATTFKNVFKIAIVLSPSRNLPNEKYGLNKITRARGTAESEFRCHIDYDLQQTKFSTIWEAD